MPNPDSYGVVTAEAWSEIYPDQYATYLENKANSPTSGKHSYLELYPALNTMYKGYAFALGYDEASSHVYTLQSVKETPRTIEREQLAGCITCKTPQFTALVNSEGDAVYKEKFNDLIGQFTSHNWNSPLENPELIEKDCSKCHKDIAAQVKEIQTAEEERVTAISEKIETLTKLIATTYADEINAMKAAKEAGTEIPAPSAYLAAMQKLQREAQYYWDFVMVENSEGAHNSALTNDCLDKAEKAADAGIAAMS